MLAPDARLIRNQGRKSHSLLPSKDTQVAFACTVPNSWMEYLGVMRGEFDSLQKPRMKASFHGPLCAKFISRRDGLEIREG